jgi:hypothetical protein
MPMCMSSMEVQIELSTIENPWSFHYGYFLTSSIGALERNEKTSGNASKRKVFISLGSVG